MGSVTDTPPTAEAGWRDFSGTAFLYRQSDSPGDLTRPFLCDADNTRPGQMTAWLQWPGGSTVTVDAGGDGRQPQYIVALVNDPTAWGFVGYDLIGGVTSYWRWNGTKFAYQRIVQSIPSNQTTTRLPPATNVYVGQTTYPMQTVVPTGTNLWMPLGPGGGAGLTDISVAAAAGVGVANAVTTFVYFDILFVIASTGGNLTITPYRPNTPGVGNVLNSVTYTGLAPALATIPGESVCLGAVGCEGAVYIVTERSVYGFQWNDLTNTMLTTKLLELPRLTSGPVVWNGEVYIGADNRIVHIVPGQRGFDWRVPDPAGRTAPPIAGSIVALTPAPDALFAQVVDANPTTNAGWCILRMDTNGIWSLPYIANGSSLTQPYGPPVPVVDGTNPYGLAYFNAAFGSIGSATILPFPQAGRNPRTLTVAQRPQRSGPFRCITPWYDLESETAQKQLERFRTAAQGVSTANPINVYYQLDYADELGTDTFTSGVAKGSGTWHLCGNLKASATAYAGSIDANGNGALWWEFDGTTNYTNVGVLTRYPTYKRVRWCLELVGDSTGASVPTLLSHAFHRLEYVTKAYERDIAIRLRVNELQGASAVNGTVTYANNAAIKTARNALKALNSAKTVCTYVDEWGDSHTVVITKYEANVTAIDGNGQPGEYVIQLSIMDVPLVGQN